MHYVIEFELAEGKRLYSGIADGAMGFAPTLATATVFDSEGVAERTLANGYGSYANDAGRVVPVEVNEDGMAVRVKHLHG